MSVGGIGIDEERKGDTHTHTHTHIYIYIERERERNWIHPTYHFLNHSNVKQA